MPKVASQPPSTPRRPKANSKATPPTTGGRTIGSTVTARNTARPGKLRRANVQASGTPKTRAMAVAENEASRERRSAVKTSGERSWSQVAAQGVRRTMPISGMTKNAAPTAANTRSATGAAGRALVALRTGKAIAGQSRLAGAKEIRDERLSQWRVLRILKDRDRIVGHDVLSRRNFHTLHSGAGRLHIGDVDDAGISLAQRHLADDRLDIGLQAGRLHNGACFLQRLRGVTPARNSRGAQHHDESGMGEVREPRDVFRVTGPDCDLETIVGEDRRRAGDETGINEFLHGGLIGGREHIADRALLDLCDEGRRSTRDHLDYGPGVAPLEAIADRGVGRGQRGGLKDRDRAAHRGGTRGRRRAVAT